MICYAHKLLNIKGFAEVFPCSASELSISVRYYVLWHTTVWVYKIEKLVDKVFRGSVLYEWKYLDILGESVKDCPNLVIDNLLSVFFLTFGGSDRKSMAVCVNGWNGIGRGLANPCGGCVENVVRWQVSHCLQ